MGIQKIYLGASPGDKTGTDARAAGAIINNNFELLASEYFKDAVLKTGVVVLVDLSLSVAASAFAWRINQVDYTVPPAYSVTLTAATVDNFRYDILQGNALGGYSIKQGVEGFIIGTPPLADADCIVLASILVFGDTIENTSVISVDYVDLYGNGGATDLLQVNKDAVNFIIHNATSLTGFNITTNNLYHTKDYYLRNNTTGVLELESDIGTNNTRFYFNGQSLKVPRFSTVHLKFLITGSFGGLGFMILVGIIPDFSPYEKILDNDEKLLYKQDNLTDITFATFVNSTTTKDVIIDADKLGYFNSVNSKWVNTTWLKVVDYFKGYFQTKPQLITTATTATKGSKYIATGTFAITDFASPVQGDEYKVFVRNGTITIAGIAYKTGTIIKRIFDATWKSYVYRQQLPIKISTGVTGNYDIDPTISDEFSLTLTGNTNLYFPNFSTVFSDVVSFNVAGNFGITYEAGTKVVGSYIGSATMNVGVVKKTNGVVTVSWTNYL